MTYSLGTQLWTVIYELCNKDAFNVYVYGTLCVTVGVFWVTSGLFLIVDYTGHPSALVKYKVQPGKNQPLSTDKMLRAVCVGLRNQVTVDIPYNVGLYLMFRYVRGLNFHPLDFPSWQKILLDLVVCLAFGEAGFYYLHRLFHHPTLYKRFHKKHHEWTAPIGLAAIYAHPLEHILANLTPLILGPLVMGSHPATIWLWFTIVTVNTVNNHSGYHLPFCNSPEYHDFHHLKTNTNYGSLGVMDWLHGTDVMFQQSKAKLRHKVLTSLTPLSISVP